jgi:hypothetical protein
LICNDGTIYEGQYKNNMPHGSGKMIYRKVEGCGVELYPMEFEFYGKFKEGKKVNPGKL